MSTESAVVRGQGCAHCICLCRGHDRSAKPNLLHLHGLRLALVSGCSKMYERAHSTVDGSSNRPARNSGKYMLNCYN